MSQWATARSGVRLAFDSAGKGGAGILFVHGWCCDRSHFKPQFDHFATRETAAAWDMRGHGDSARPTAEGDAYAIGTLAEDALAVADAAGLCRPIVVGHSLGGLVALACAAKSDRVRGAVLVNPAWVIGEQTKAFFARSYPAIAADNDGSWRAAFAKRLLRGMDEPRREEIRASVNEVPAAIAAATWRAMSDFDSVAALGAARVPLLAIHSEQVDADLKTLAPQMALRRTQGGHFNQLEAPDEVIALIAEFLEGPQTSS